MFEHETDIIISTVKQRIPHLGTPGHAIAVKDILAADIPYPLKAFFRADVESMLGDELHQQRKGSRFNYSHPEAQSLQQQINSVLVMQYLFERQEFLTRLDDAVHLMLNYLVRPQWTLGNVIFEKEKVISAAALIRLMRYFGPYEYLRDLITRFVQEKNVSSFTQQEFTNHLWKLDGEFIRRKTGDELARILSPLYDFLDYPKNTGINSVSMKALIKFFEDKGLSTAFHRLEGELAQDKHELSRHALGEILEDLRRSFGAFEVEKPHVEHAEPISVESKSEEKPASMTSPVSVSMDDGDRKRFIKKIFKHDESTFTSAMKKLDEIAGWKQASVFIDEVFIQNEVDPYSSDAKRFIEVVSQKFFQKR